MTQQEALEIMLSGANVFLTGAPGAGKTYVLNEFIEAAREKGRSVAVTASTGIAASHIGGTTIHSWAGIGISDTMTKQDLQRYRNNSRLVKRLKKADVLVIDEISMLHGLRLDMVNALAKELRRDKTPFGGLQVILVGDLFQLPPVTRGTELLDFVHTSNAWARLELSICYLTEQHRQEGDDGLLGLLEAMRCNTVTDDHLELLRSRMSDSTPEDVTRLYAHNVAVDAINQEHLDALKGKTVHYKMKRNGDKFKIETLERNILAPADLELKVGAEVMFVANNFQDGFVNGTRGKVIKFAQGNPVVKTTKGRTIRVERHEWSVKDEEDRVIASIEQIPLRLAWAITIHKSQGMSLDAAEVDLSKAFTPGMGYVALSRVRSLDGLYLKGYNDMALTMHGEIYEFDAELRKASEEEK